MSGSATLSAEISAEYAAIEATICATERGRLFLAEHARRNRGADTEMLLGAISRLEQTVTADRGHPAFGQLRGNLVDMAEAIRRTKAEIAAISASNTEQTRLSQASLALDAIVRETERATSDILGAAEAIQEAAWTLRERGADATACDDLDRLATAIYTACSFQDLTAQRTAEKQSAIEYARAVQGGNSLLIVDAEKEEAKVPELIKKLREENPKLKLILLCLDSRRWSSIVQSLGRFHDLEIIEKSLGVWTLLATVKRMLGVRRAASKAKGLVLESEVQRSSDILPEEDGEEFHPQPKDD